MLQKLIDSILDIKGIIKGIGAVIILAVILVMVNALQHSPLSQNEVENATLENAKVTVAQTVDWYFIAEAIVGSLALIVAVAAIVGYLFFRDNSGGDYGA